MAGFWAGFGEQMSTNIEQRQKTLDRLIEENLDNARVAKRDYAKRKGTADSVLKSAKAIREKFGLSDEQALAVTEAYGTDLPKLQATLDAENDKLRSNLGVSYTADDVMSFVNISGELSKAKGTSLDEGVRRLMGLNYQELAKEPDPKSEGSKVRSFIRSALAFDPQLQAADKMQDIKGPGGMSYAQLLEMQEAGFAPDEVFGDVTRSGGVTYDYTASTAKQTRSDYARRLSTKVFSADLTDPVDFGNYTGGDDTEKAQLKSSVQGAGEALARLEKDIVLANRGTDLAMNAFRKGILDDIYSRVDTAEELDTLRESINNGIALDIVQETGGKLTDRDIDAIILGAKPEEDINVQENMPLGMRGSEATASVAKSKEEPVPSILDEATKSIYDALPDEDKPDLTGVEDPDVARMIVQQAAEGTGKEEEVEGITYAEWKGMSRKEREEAGYPVSTLGGETYFKRFGVGLGTVDEDQKFPPRAEQEPEEEEETDTAPNDIVEPSEDTGAEESDAATDGSLDKTSDTIKAIETQAEFIQTHFNDLLDYFDDVGIDQTDKNDIKLALADWFSDNAEKLEIPSTLRTEDIAETIYKAFNDKES